MNKVWILLCDGYYHNTWDSEPTNLQLKQEGVPIDHPIKRAPRFAGRRWMDGSGEVWLLREVRPEQGSGMVVLAVTEREGKA